jgi:predicted GTPase
MTRKSSKIQYAFFRLFDSALSAVPQEAADLLRVDIAVIGVTGVGKTSTCNALLGTNWAVGHTKATTRDMHEKQLVLNDAGKEISTNVSITDFPGLGETLTRDSEYVPLHLEHLPRFDAIIWLLPANDRQLSLIQMFCKQFADLDGFQDRIIFGLNKADLVEPMEWAKTGANLPSHEQEANIAERVTDFVTKMQSEGLAFVTKERVVPFSAKHAWRVWEMFASVRGVLPGAKCLSFSRYGRPAEWEPYKTDNSNSKGK